jgi:hypothetical protein
MTRAKGPQANLDTAPESELRRLYEAHGDEYALETLRLIQRAREGERAPFALGSQPRFAFTFAFTFARSRPSVRADVFGVK